MAQRKRLGVGLTRIVSRTPSGSESVDALFRRIGAPASRQRLFTRFYGLERSPILGPDETFEDLLVSAASTALAHRGRSDTTLVLYGHTLTTQPMDYDPGFPDRIRGALSLPDVPFHGISQIGCTSVLRSIDLAARFLDSEKGREGSVLVLGGDVASISDAMRVLPGVTVAGDSAVAFHVRPGSARYTRVGHARSSDTRFYRNLGLNEEEAREFGGVCAEKTIEVCAAALADAGLKYSDIDWIMPHRNNAQFWRTFCSRTGYPRERVYLEQLAELGHCYGNDSLMALSHADELGRLSPSQRCLLVSIGQGAYFEACVVEVGDADEDS